MSNTITIAAPPTVADVATDLIAWMSGQSGVVTDYNRGSQYRTNAEAMGAVADMQGIICQALAFQALVYSAFSAFNIFPLAAQPAIGTVTFSTGTSGSPPPAVSSVLIAAGTLVSTVGGSQFQTTADVTLPNGSTSVAAPVQAVIAGLNGNVPSTSITDIVTGLSYPLFVNNAAPTTGGTDAETPAQTMARFTAVVASLGLATPVAIANACIGVAVSGTAERVRYSTVYEPWIALGITGSASFKVYVDNGSGAASSGLLATVQAVLDGNRSTGQDGYRPAGVPYSVNAVVPVDYTVVVSGTAVLASQDAALESSVTQAITDYEASLLFGQPAELTQIIAAVANATAGGLTGLQVWLFDSSHASQQVIQPAEYQRLILTGQTVVIN